MFNHPLFREITSLGVRDPRLLHEICHLHVVFSMLHPRRERTFVPWSEYEVTTQLRYMPLLSDVLRILQWSLPDALDDIPEKTSSGKIASLLLTSRSAIE